jgi:hypothetical protein
LLLVGRRPETDSGWLGGDAGEYCGETSGENCEAGVLSTCEPGETAEPAVLAWLPNILSKHTLFKKNPKTIVENTKQKQNRIRKENCNRKISEENTIQKK